MPMIPIILRGAVSKASMSSYPNPADAAATRAQFAGNMMASLLGASGRVVQAEFTVVDGDPGPTHAYWPDGKLVPDMDAAIAGVEPVIAQAWEASPQAAALRAA